uniref:Shisa N-terminal domain-containing protein n=1 Tax=Lates calcarifer TaxID=8187 RepID=A0A4W6EY60_LATCA
MCGQPVSDMSSDCESYYSKENVFVGGFTCPKTDGDTTALFCCGFSDLKYCCDDPNSFFPYEYGYMWWLRFYIKSTKTRNESYHQCACWSSRPQETLSEWQAGL